MIFFALVVALAVALGVLLAMLFGYFIRKAGPQVEQSDDDQSTKHGALSEDNGMPRHYVTSDPLYNKDGGFL